MRSQGAEATGTTPPGTRDEEQASRWVRRIFEDVAPKYDLLNHLLSFNIDRGWRKRLVERLHPVLQSPGTLTLDLCCGTGDVLFDLQNGAASPVIGADFCHPMLVTAAGKAKRRGTRAALLEADALHLPLSDASLDAVAIAFGFRNLSNYGAGLNELHRVLKKNGTLTILEFSHPQGLLTKAGYGLYSRILLPAIGGIVSGSREAYTYLPESIGKFPHADELRDLMIAHGFLKTDYELLTGGIAALHVGTKP